MVFHSPEGPPGKEDESLVEKRKRRALYVKRKRKETNKNVGEEMGGKLPGLSRGRGGEKSDILPSIRSPERNSPKRGFSSVNRSAI